MHVRRRHARALSRGRSSALARARPVGSSVRQQRSFHPCRSLARERALTRALARARKAATVVALRRALARSLARSLAARSAPSTSTVRPLPPRGDFCARPAIADDRVRSSDQTSSERARPGSQRPLPLPPRVSQQHRSGSRTIVGLPRRRETKAPARMTHEVRHHESPLSLPPSYSRAFRHSPLRSLRLSPRLYRYLFLLVFTILLLCTRSAAGHTLPRASLRREWSSGARYAALREGYDRRVPRFAGGHVSPRDRPIAVRADVSSLTKDVFINQAWVVDGSGVGAD